LELLIKIFIQLSNFRFSIIKNLIEIDITGRTLTQSLNRMLSHLNVRTAASSQQGRKVTIFSPKLMTNLTFSEENQWVNFKHFALLAVKKWRPPDNKTAARLVDVRPKNKETIK
jgi:hypothetical protein